MSPDRSPTLHGDFVARRNLSEQGSRKTALNGSDHSRPGGRPGRL